MTLLHAFAATCGKECGRYVFLYQIYSKLTVLQPKPRQDMLRNFGRSIATHDNTNNKKVSFGTVCGPWHTLDGAFDVFDLKSRFHG